MFSQSRGWRNFVPLSCHCSSGGLNSDSSFSQLTFFAVLSKVLPAWIPCLTLLPIKDDALQDTLFRRLPQHPHWTHHRGVKPPSGLSPLTTWSSSSGLVRHFIYTLYSGARNTWLWEGKQLFNSCTLINRMGRQALYLCTDWCGQCCSYVHNSSSRCGVLNASRGKLSTFWKSCPPGTTTVVTELRRKRLKFRSLLEICCLLSRSYSQELFFSKGRWHNGCLSAHSIEKTD